MSDDSKAVAGCCSTAFYVVATLLVVIFSLIYSGYGKKILKSFQESFMARMLFKFGKKAGVALAPYKQPIFDDLATLAKSLPSDSRLNVVEIGAGSGANFGYYPKGTVLTCVEPNRKCEQYLMKNLEERKGEIELKEYKIGKAEDMSFLEAESVDAVVCTHVLCSVDDVEKSLQESKRILKKGGKFYYMEHVIPLENTPAFTKVKYVAPIFYQLMGCHLNQDTLSYINQAGFKEVQNKEFHANDLLKLAPFFFRPICKVAARNIIGIATK